MNMHHEITVSQARRNWEAYQAVCLATRDGKQGRARSWQFATLKRDEYDTLWLRGPGRKWYEFNPSNACATFGVTELNRMQRITWSMARVLHRILEGETNVQPKAAALLETVNCCACGELLTHPDSIVADAGPTCRGEVARRDAKREAKRAARDTFMQRMAERMGR